MKALASTLGRRTVMNSSCDRQFATWHYPIQAALFRRLTTQTDGSPVPRPRVSRKCRPIWPTLHRMWCSNQGSQSKSRRSGAAFSFQFPSGELQTTTLQPRIHLTCWTKKNGRNSGRTCVSLFICFFSALLSVLFGSLATRAPVRDSQRWMWTRRCAV